jgi:hypothetical protein
MKVVRTEPLRNTSITTLEAAAFYDEYHDRSIHKYAEKLSGDLWRAGVEYEVTASKDGAWARVTDADGEEWFYSHDYAIVALAGAAEMASGRRAEVQVGNTIHLVPASIAEYEKERLEKE